MLTRIALLFSIVWLADLREPLFAVLGNRISGRRIILFGGGAVPGGEERHGNPRHAAGERRSRTRAGVMQGFWLIILQIGIIDIVFSLDSVFTAVGLAKHIEVMVAAIVVSVLVMMVVSSAVGRFIDGYPTIKVLALAFLVLVGAALIAESLDLEIPQGLFVFRDGILGGRGVGQHRLRRRSKSVSSTCKCW